MPINIPTSDEIRIIIRQELAAAMASMISPKVDNTLVTQVDVMRRYRISKPTVIAWGKKGKLKPVRMGGKVYYKAVELP